MESVSQCLFKDSFCATLWQHMKDPVFIYPLHADGAAGHFVLANPAAAKAVGYGKEELFAMTPEELEESDYAQERSGVELAHLPDDQTAFFETIHRHKDGALLPVHIHARKLTISDQVFVMQSAFYLQSKDEQLTIGLAKANQRLRFIMNKARAGTWEWDLLTNENSWSDEIWELYGLPPYSARPSYDAWLESILEEDRESAAATVREASMLGIEFTTEWRVRNDKGELRWLMTKGTPMRNSCGDVVRYVGMVLDITDHKQIELEKEQLEKQILEAQRLETVGQLAGGIAHDYNNMLAVIMGHAEQAIDYGNPSAELRSSLETIIDITSRSAKLTAQLLTFAQKQPVLTQVIELNGAISHTAGMIRPLLGANIELDCPPPASGLTIRIDPTQLDQILLNLCLNARDAIDSAGCIRITTALVDSSGGTCPTCDSQIAMGKHVTMVVSDNGRGIEAQHLPHIFNPFYTTKKFGQGSGMGLASVYGIVKQNNGHIRCSSIPGKGTSFTLCFPLEEESNGHPNGAAGESTAHNGKASGTILLVEDNKEIRRLCAQVLANEGYEVLEATGPLEALRLAAGEEKRIDLLLTDIILPNMNGMELCNNLAERRPDLLSLFMSGYSSGIINIEEDDERFIQKPFSIKRLKEKVRVLLLKRHNGCRATPLA